MADTRQQSEFEVECPHCHKSFAAEPMRGGRAARYRGFKCPHCKLFVPLARVSREIDATAPISRSDELRSSDR